MWDVLKDGVNYIFLKSPVKIRKVRKRKLENISLYHLCYLNHNREIRTDVHTINTNNGMERVSLYTT